MALERERWRFTVAEYHRMAQAGILNEDDRVELIDGEVVKMTPIGPPHAACVTELSMHFARAVGHLAVVWSQNPIHLGEHSEPEPDLALLRPRPGGYRARHPIPDDVLLVVEVALSSVEYDRRVKVPLYAQSGVPETWLVDLEQEIITIYQDPTPSGYRTARVVRRGEQIAPLAFPDCLIAVSDILG